jgi:hypothetical protein
VDNRLLCYNVAEWGWGEGVGKQGSPLSRKSSLAEQWKEFSVFVAVQAQKHGWDGAAELSPASSFSCLDSSLSKVGKSFLGLLPFLLWWRLLLALPSPSVPVTLIFLIGRVT